MNADNVNMQKDSPAWMFYVWTAFAISGFLMLSGIYYMPVDGWIKAYFVMGYFFSIGSTFSLAKTLRDNYEAKRLINRVVEAKTERILQEYELKKAA